GDAADEKAMAARSEFPDRIVVPFCRESKLSGLGRTGFVKNVLYRRSFEVPAAWHVEKDGAHVLIHVGACDWRTTDRVNGTKVGFHEGGSTPIDCDATSALHPGANELRVWAFDDTTSGVQQLGKQCPKEKSYGCLYTRTTGIWQTVWMERVPKASIEAVTMTTTLPWIGVSAPTDFLSPAIVLVTPRFRGLTTEAVIGVQITRKIPGIDGESEDHMEAFAETVEPASNEGRPLWIPIQRAHSWSIGD